MEKKIYYHDTDAGGVVYYANYLKYMEEARTEFLIHKGVPIDSFKNNQFLYAVINCNITYKSPARYGDIIVCDAKLKKISAAKLFFTQTIKNKKTDNVLVFADVTLVSLNNQFKPTPIPESIKMKLKRGDRG